MSRLTMMLVLVGLAAVFVISLLSSAAREQSTPFGERQVLKDGLQRQVKQNNEWRMAQLIPPGAWEKVLGWVAPGDVIRFAAGPRELAEKAITGRVCVDGEKVVEFALGGKIGWIDYQTAIPKNTSGEATVEFESGLGFQLAWCEIARRQPQKPNILVILVDTLRQDHLGCYGYTRPTSPTLDILAQDAIRFTRLVPQASWTRPSVASLLTSCYPSVHGAIDRNTPMRPGMPSLASALHHAGYEAHMFMGNPSCLPYWEIGTDFDRVLDLVEQNAERQDDATIIDAALQTLPSFHGRPWFFYVHLMGPHSPYIAREPYKSTFTSRADGNDSAVQRLIDAYDAEIAYTDAQIARLLSALRDQGMYENTCIVLLADHGEQFYEHGEWGHGLSLYEEELRVPLLVKLPGNAHAGKSFDNLLQTIDIAPTLCEIAGAQPDGRFQGRSFFGLIKGDVPWQDRYAYASLALENRSAHMSRTTTVKFLDDRTAKSEQWFDLQNDPREQHPVATPDSLMQDLRRFAFQTASLNTEGLNILITGGENRLGTVKGTISGTQIDVEAAKASNPGFKIEKAGDSYVFYFDPSLSSPSLYGMEEWYARGEQSSAHIRLPIQSATPLSLQLYVDGVRVPEVTVADKSQTTKDASAAILPGEITADPLQFDPAVLPRKQAAYVWYVPASQEIPDEKMDERIKEALTSLGYLN